MITRRHHLKCFLLCNSGNNDYRASVVIIMIIIIMVGVIIIIIVIIIVIIFVSALVPEITAQLTYKYAILGLKMAIK